MLLLLHLSKNRRSLELVSQWSQATPSTSPPAPSHFITMIGSIASSRPASHTKCARYGISSCIPRKSVLDEEDSNVSVIISIHFHRNRWVRTFGEESPDDLKWWMKNCNPEGRFVFPWDSEGEESDIDSDDLSMWNEDDLLIGRPYPQFWHLLRTLRTLPTILAFWCDSKLL